MKILFLSLMDFESLEERGMYTELLHEFHKHGHSIYAISPVERKKKEKTRLLRPDQRIYIVKLKIGNIQKTNLIEKGITTISLESQFIHVIKRYFSDVKFDMVLYSTPPITFQRTVCYVKKRDGALTYLMLKDIFPQNAVDLGMMSQYGLKGILYRYFRKKEKKLYKDSDCIGCMSQANVDYILKYNPELEQKRLEVCPNCMEPSEVFFAEEEKKHIREMYAIPKDKTVFIYGGNLGKPQGIPFILRCLKKLSKIKEAFFLIVGSGTEYPIIEKYLYKQYMSNVKLIEYLPREDYEKLVRACDVGMIFLDYHFTIPNFPSRLLSYMDAGLPVLAATDRNTDIGKIIVDAGFGWWCESNDIQGFQKLVKSIICQDIKEKGNTSYKYFKEKYTTNISYQIILKSYMNCMER